MGGGGTTPSPGHGATARSQRAGNGLAELSLETSRAAELYREGKLPLTSAEAAADARRGLARWIGALFRRRGG